MKRVDRLSINILWNGNRTSSRPGKNRNSGVKGQKKKPSLPHQKEHFVNYFLTCYVLPGNDLRPVG